MTRVRVGIVSWNTADHLKWCLEALPSALAGLDAEIVVIDNASSDGSAEVAKSFAQVHLEKLDSNIGYARAMNMALSISASPVLIALNPDIQPPPGSLTRLVESLLRRPGTGLVAPRLVNPDGSQQHSIHRFPTLRQGAVVNLLPRILQRGPVARRFWIDAYAPFDRSCEIDWAIGAVHCIRAAALDGAPAYNERSFMYVEDLDLCWRLRRSGWKVFFDADTSITHVGNAAGSQAWTDADRTKRWWKATYDWIALEQGPSMARAYALLGLVGATTKSAANTILARVDTRRTARRRYWAHILYESIPIHIRTILYGP